jgi:hypothetical protein
VVFAGGMIRKCYPVHNAAGDIHNFKHKIPCIRQAVRQPGHGIEGIGIGGSKCKNFGKELLFLSGKGPFPDDYLIRSFPPVQSGNAGQFILRIP